MEERYEIRSKLGQGGFGSVYRAFDKRMNREVAIKRISASDEDGMLEAAAQQLVKEAGSLASLQHPNIVTIYDVGHDEDGPYVVMELLTGNPLDELIDKAPLMREDFRELALQTQEALIGAQELGLVHRDIKPANIMLNWLPSGKFQVKLLDFGLAKLIQRPTLQTMNQADSIFGSIFFMAPEQFERSPIDCRTDMYAMGCVYYYALTGAHPFDGSTAAEVMSAHLQNHFTPLHDVRPDLPKWICDWVMWHMNRYPDDRPASAHDALEIFIQNDRFAANENPPATEEPKPSSRPKLLIPGAPQPAAQETVIPHTLPSGAVQISTKTAPQPLIPPTGRLSPHSTRQVVLESTNQEITPQPAEDEHASLSTEACRQPSQNPQPDASLPEPHRAEEKTVRKGLIIPTQPSENQAPPDLNNPPAPTAETTSEPAATNAPPLIKRTTLNTGGNPGGPLLQPSPLQTAPQASATSSSTNPPQNKPAIGFPNNPIAQTTHTSTPKAVSTPTNQSAKIAVMSIAAVLVILMSWFVMQKISAGKTQRIFNDRIALAAQPETTSVPVDKSLLDMMLRSVRNVGSNAERETIYRALYLASATDSTDIDAEIVKLVINQEMVENVRQILINQVLRRRANPAVVDPLLKFAQTTPNKGAAVASLQAIRSMADDRHMEPVISIIQFASDVETRAAAEDVVAEILGKSPNRTTYASQFQSIFETSVNDDARHAALRLIGRVGNPSSLDLIRKTLAQSNVKDQIAALNALTSWRDEKGFPILIDFLNTIDDANLRSRGYDAAIRYATTLDDAGLDGEVRRDIWLKLAETTSTPEAQEKLIRALANNLADEWVTTIIGKFTQGNQDDRIMDVAERAIKSVNSRKEKQD